MHSAGIVNLFIYLYACTYICIHTYLSASVYILVVFIETILRVNYMKLYGNVAWQNAGSIHSPFIVELLLSLCQVSRCDWMDRTCCGSADIMCCYLGSSLLNLVFKISSYSWIQLQFPCLKFLPGREDSGPNLWN